MGSECGHTDGKKSFTIREWTCPICRTHHDRNVNVSINILIKGYVYKHCLRKTSRTLGTTGIDWLIRDIAVSKDIGLQVYSFIKNSVALVMIGLIL
ncbi:TPA: transposase [Enterococcus faecium]|nr:transposase [Enterococcus faecium]